jgi:hypothetical protein
MNSIKKTARIAGFFYLMFIATSILADRLASIGFGDAAAIVNKITAHEQLFRIGFITGLVSAMFFLLAAWALYVLLKQVNENLALLFLLLNLVGVAVQCFCMFGLFGGFILFSGANYLKAFPADQLQALALFFVNLYKNGFMIAQLFYCTWLLPLGYLVYKSGYLPKILGILLIIDCFGVLIWFFQFFLFPGYDVISYPGLLASAIAEFSLTLWLLIMGVRDQKPPIIKAG